MSSDKITLKSASDIEHLKTSGKILSAILKTLAEMLRPGLKGDTLNAEAENLAKKNNARCSFKGFEGYPANICLSRNNEVVHGFPFGKIIRKGDIVGLDLGIDYKGFFTDSAVTIVFADIDKAASLSVTDRNRMPSDITGSSRILTCSYEEKQKLADTTLQCLKSTLKFCKPGYRLGDIGFAVQNLAESRGYSVVKKLVGHGVGYSVHEMPLIPNYGGKSEGLRLKPGMVLAIEPMVNVGTDDVMMDKKDGWTFYTADGSLSAHFEWTIAITSSEPIVLTPLDWIDTR